MLILYEDVFKLYFISDLIVIICAYLEFHVGDYLCPIQLKYNHLYLYEIKNSCLNIVNCFCSIGVCDHIYHTNIELFSAINYIHELSLVI